MQVVAFHSERFDADLYLSFLVTVCIVGVLMFSLHKAWLLPPHTAALMQRPTALLPNISSNQGVSTSGQLSNSTIEALRQTDAILTKRIIALATKVGPAFVKLSHNRSVSVIDNARVVQICIRGLRFF